MFAPHINITKTHFIAGIRNGVTLKATGDADTSGLAI
jgi:hypothetical protein